MLLDLSAACWRKARASGNQGTDCVELAYAGAVRDSKNPATVLPVDVPALVAVKAHMLGR